MFSLLYMMNIRYVIRYITTKFTLVVANNFVRGVDLIFREVCCINFLYEVGTVIFFDQYYNHSHGPLYN
jgi:hypothetical protein